MARVPDIWPVEKIRVVGRYRLDLGDLTELAASIRDHGLINPITVDEAGRLLAGGRRLAAVKLVGFTDVRVNIIETLGDVLKELQVEEAENLHRKELTLTEKVRQGEAIRAVLAERAREKQRAALARGNITRHLPGSIGADGTGEKAPRAANEAATQTAKALGMGGTNYRAIRTVQTIADDEDATPEAREAANAALQEIDAGAPVERVTDAFRARYGRRNSKAEPEEVPEGASSEPAAPMHHNTRRRRVREQTERFDGLATQLAGMKMGIDGLLRDELPLIEPDMVKVAQWVSDLQSARKSIIELVKRLKEITP